MLKSAIVSSTMAAPVKFDTLVDAQASINDVVDRPVASTSEVVRSGIKFSATAIDLGDGQFTNSYDLAFDSEDVLAEVTTFDQPTGVYEHMQTNGVPGPNTAASGGFFYLADISSSFPRQRALNLSISEGNLRSLPVSDQEAVIGSKYGLEGRYISALGWLTIGKHEIAWSGSLTPYETEAKIFSNGNTVIRHQPHELTGQVRVLDEASRFTPPIFDEDYVDVGFIGRGGNDFIATGGSAAGELDIFAHDFVVRCPKRYFDKGTDLQVHTLDDLTLDDFIGGGFSTGPDMLTPDFAGHPINRDASLGSKPPFTASRMARMALYQTADGLKHLHLFDGRPRSASFPGVTPDEAVSLISTAQDIAWGYFLDPGQTAKLCVATPDGVASYGNRHYLRWPDAENPGFTWVPDSGRPIANVITVQ